MQKWLRVLAVLMVLALLAGCGGSSGSGSKDPIKLGAIFDLTGGTADVGKPHADGVRAYIEYINGKGGVNGRQIQLVDTDYGYGVQKATEAYKKFVNEDKIVAMIGWGTGDTEAMKGLIAEDKIPFISGSYAETLVNPAQTPYNFIVSATYSQQARVMLDWAKKQNPKAKAAFVYNDTAFGKSPLEDAKKYAQQIGLEWVGEVVVALNATDATTQLLDLDKKGATFVLIQETTNATAVTLKGAQKLGLLGKMQFAGLTYSVDEGLIKAAGEAAEGFIGTPSFAFATDKGKGVEEMLEFAKSKGKGPADIHQKYVQGWAFGRIVVEALKKAGSNLTGESIKKAYESFNNLNLEGLGAPLTFTDKDHMGARQAKVHQVKGGKWVAVQDWAAPLGK